MERGSSRSHPFFSREFDRRVWITAGVLAISFLVGGLLTLYAAWPTRIRVGYAPVQPLPYSHQLHAGSLDIRCRYCHVGVDTSAEAGVPPVSVCMNCHAHFAGDEKDPEQVKKIRALTVYWEQEKPIVWEKVYDLEDFVYFHHGRHVSSGLDCWNCHGPVETMPRVEAVTPLTMGWCLKCHMGRGEFELEPDFVRTGKKGAQIVNDPVYREILAPINCSACHR